MYKTIFFIFIFFIFVISQKSLQASKKLFDENCEKLNSLKKKITFDFIKQGSPEATMDHLNFMESIKKDRKLQSVIKAALNGNFPKTYPEFIDLIRKNDVELKPSLKVLYVMFVTNHLCGSLSYSEEKLTVKGMQKIIIKLGGINDSTYGVQTEPTCRDTKVSEKEWINLINSFNNN